MYINPGDSAIRDYHATAVHELMATDMVVSRMQKTLELFGPNLLWFNTLAADVPAVILVTLVSFYPLPFTSLEQGKGTNFTFTR